MQIQLDLIHQSQLDSILVRGLHFFQKTYKKLINTVIGINSTVCAFI